MLMIKYALGRGKGSVYKDDYISFANPLPFSFFINVRILSQKKNQIFKFSFISFNMIN